MSRINTNIPALIGTRILNNNTLNLNKSLEKLSTGLRINRGSDDPAGLIASENLRKQIRGTETAIKNAERAAMIVSTAEGALQEVSTMLLDVQALLGEAANIGGTSTEEVAANQSQVDSIINSINRIANTTDFAGIKLLNGEIGYTTSGVSSTNFDEVNIRSAKLIDGAAMTIDVTVTASAQTGRVLLSQSAAITSTFTLELGTGRGTTELTFASGAVIGDLSTGINTVREVTGISAFVSGASLVLDSIDFGSDAFVSVTVLTASASIGVDAASTAKDFGVDISATVNGAAATGIGKTLAIRTAMLDAEIDITAGTAAALSGGANMSFDVTGGGSDFSLGAEVTSVGLEPLGVQSIVASKLGNSTDGFLNTLKSGGTNALNSTNLITSQKIVDAAIKDITTLRGRLGNFQKNTLETTMNSLAITNENLAAAESAIRDTDFARETANLTRGQILVNAATSVLAQANFAPQSVLSLLG